MGGFQYATKQILQSSLLTADTKLMSSLAPKKPICLKLWKKKIFFDVLCILKSSTNLALTNNTFPSERESSFGEKQKLFPY